MKKNVSIVLLCMMLVTIVTGCSDISHIIQHRTYEYSELDAMVAEYEEKVDIVEPKADSASKVKQFIKIQMEAEKIEEKIELYEDDLEYRIEADELSLDEFDLKEQEVEELQARIEIALAKLARKFNVTD